MSCVAIFLSTVAAGAVSLDARLATKTRSK
jgi:hypothetical protein